MNSNASHPLPRANTGSSVKNWVSNTLVFLVQMERRIDHWIRPPFDFLFRDLTARVVRALINSKRKDEGLKIAEEKPLPDEEQFVNSVISSFEKQMADLWKPGGYERGGNTKTKGSCAASLLFTKICPRSSGRASLPSRGHSLHGCDSRAPVPM